MNGTARHSDARVVEAREGQTGHAADPVNAL
jgi:hypothetical protein